MSLQDLQNIISPKFTTEVVLDFLAKQSHLKDVKVNKIELGEDSKKGDSYISTICRFRIEATGINKSGQEETVSLPVIVKYLPKNVARRKTYRSSDFFENEIIFYNKVWSAFEKFQNDTHIVKKFDNVPIVLSTHFDGANDYIAMLDLGSEGYTSAERGTGLDFDHASAILHLLARFHALSLAFKELHPEEFEAATNTLKETYFSEKLRPWNSRFRQNVFGVIRDAVEKELPLKYLQKLDKLNEGDLYGLMIKSCVVKGPLSVVTHGDVWVPNFLIKYEGKKPGAIKMIDFQLTRYTTLVSDLSFFLYSCVSMDLVEHKWDELIGLYHQALTEGIRQFGAQKTPTLEEIHAELKDHCVMGVGMSMEALIMSQLDDDEVCDLDGIQGDKAVPLEDVWITRPFEQQEKRKRIASMIKLAVDRNFI